MRLESGCAAGKDWLSTFLCSAPRVLCAADGWAVEALGVRAQLGTWWPVPEAASAGCIHVSPRMAASQPSSGPPGFQGLRALT
jgi:hypothetical protein